MGDLKVVDPAHQKDQPIVPQHQVGLEEEVHQLSKLLKVETPSEVRDEWLPIMRYTFRPSQPRAARPHLTQTQRVREEYISVQHLWQRDRGRADRGILTGMLGRPSPHLRGLRNTGLSSLEDRSRSKPGLICNQEHSASSGSNNSRGGAGSS